MTRQIACLIALTPGYFVFKNENVKVKVKYSFVLHTGFAGSHLLFKHYHAFLCHPHSLKENAMVLTS
jgi:hypothetical protein